MLSSLTQKLTASLRPASPIPPEHRSNFNHLVLDMAWFGVHSGSTLSFLVIYATRLGASGEQVGLINAMPAIVAFIFALPASAWLQRGQTRSAVFWSSLAFRLFYIVPSLLPFFMGPTAQIWTIIFTLLVMNVPGAMMVVGFQALFAEAVPVEWRSYVAGLRNAVYALCATLTTLVCGFVLTALALPRGYQVVFVIGFLGAMISTYHIGKIRPVPQIPAVLETPPPAQARLRLMERMVSGLHLRVLRSPFRVTVLLMFFFHFTQYLGIPVFPLWLVNGLKFNDQVISIGSSTFNVFTFLASLVFVRVAQRLGNKRLMGLSAIGLGIYPVMISVSYSVPMYLLTSLIGGLNLAMLNGVLYNYLLERVPAHDRPAHLAWYSLALNGAMLLGSLIGPAVGVRIGLTTALLIYAGLRVLTGAAILRWG